MKQFVVTCLFVALLAGAAAASDLWSEDFDGGDPSTSFDTIGSSPGVSMSFVSGGSARGDDYLLFQQTSGTASTAGFSMDDLFTSPTVDDPYGQFGTRTFAYDLFVNPQHALWWGWPWNGYMHVGEFTNTQGDPNRIDLGGWTAGYPGDSYAFGRQAVRFTSFASDPESPFYNAWDMREGEVYCEPGWYRVVWVINPTYDDLSYTTPDGQSQEIEYESYHIWFQGAATEKTPTSDSGGPDWSLNYTQLAIGYMNNGAEDVIFQFTSYDGQVGAMIGFDTMSMTEGMPDGSYDWMPIPYLLGDIDGDGVVAFGDFLFMQQRWGTNNIAADLNGDGTVAFSDFLLLQQHWGESLPPQAVPEPVSMTVLLAGAVGLVGRKYRPDR